jgi:hypothetical protein
MASHETLVLQRLWKRIENNKWALAYCIEENIAVKGLIKSIVMCHCKVWTPLFCLVSSNILTWSVCMCLLFPLHPILHHPFPGQCSWTWRHCCDFIPEEGGNPKFLFRCGVLKTVLICCWPPISSLVHMLSALVGWFCFPRIGIFFCLVPQVTYELLWA